jgi:hypothetical protein
MIAVLVVAIVLALPLTAQMVAIALIIPFVAAIVARWLWLKGRHRLAAISFLITATLTNFLFFVCCMYPAIYLLGFLFFVGMFVLTPTIAVLGVAWGMLVARNVKSSRGVISAAWLAVMFLTVMPLASVWTLWPFRLTFLTVRPALDDLADRVAAGQVVAFPRWVGPFRLARSAVDPIWGNVGLMIDPNPNGPTGFVRVRPTAPPNRTGPFRWDDLLVVLGGGWEYREED